MFFLVSLIKQKTKIMSVSNDLELVYTGSRVEGLLIKELLEEKGIGVLKKDTLEESVIAGWANGSPEDAVQLYVESGKGVEAKKFIEAYFASRNGK